MKQRDDASIAPGSHLTEGELHTFLDGQVDVYGADRASAIRAHLDACATCRDRLAVESAVHDRAAAILGSDVGSEMLGLASLAELQARAAHGEGGAPTSRGRIERRVRWGWAATVVLSLGVGYGVGAWGPAAAPLAEEAPGSIVAAEPMVPAEAVAPAQTIVPAEAVVQAETDAPGELVAPAASQADRAQAGQAAEATDARPALDPPRTVAEGVPPRARVAPIQTPAAPQAKVALGERPPSPDTLNPRGSLTSVESLASVGAAALASVRDSLAGRPAVLGDPLNALQSAPAAPALRDVADRVAAGNAVRLSAEAARSSRILRSDATALGAAPPALSPPDLSGVSTASAAAPESTALEPRAAESDLDDFAADVSLVLEGLTIDALRWMEVWPGQEGLVSIQRFADGRRVELRVAGPAVGDQEPVVAPPANRTDPVDGWARAVRALGSGWIALDGPLSAEELAALLTTIR